MRPQAGLNLLCSWCWPQASDLSALTFQVLGLQTLVTMSNLEFSCWLSYFIIFKCFVCVCADAYAPALAHSLSSTSRSQRSCCSELSCMGAGPRTPFSQAPPPAVTFMWWLSSNMSMHGARAGVKTTFRSQFSFHHELSGIRQTWMPDLRREPLPAEPS